MAGKKAKAAKKKGRKKTIRRRPAKSTKPANPSAFASALAPEESEYKRKRASSVEVTPELEDEYLERLSLGETGIAICRDDHMPSRMHWWNYGQDNPVFEIRLREARLRQADSGFEEIQTLGDDLRSFPGREEIDKAKLQVDARKFRVARLNRRLYGDKADVNIGGQHDAPPVQASIDMSHMTAEDQRLMRELARKSITGKGEQ